jgi:hypothetical protein
MCLQKFNQAALRKQRLPDGQLMRRQRLPDGLEIGLGTGGQVWGKELKLACICLLGLHGARDFHAHPAADLLKGRVGLLNLREG